MTKKQQDIIKENYNAMYMQLLAYKRENARLLAKLEEAK